MKVKKLMSFNLEQFLAVADDTTAKAEYIKLLDSTTFKLLHRYRRTQANEHIWQQPITTQVIFFLLILEAEESEKCTTQYDLW